MHAQFSSNGFSYGERRLVYFDSVPSPGDNPETAAPEAEQTEDQKNNELIAELEQKIESAEGDSEALAARFKDFAENMQAATGKAVDATQEAALKGVEKSLDVYTDLEEQHVGLLKGEGEHADDAGFVRVVAKTASMRHEEFRARGDALYAYILKQEGANVRLEWRDAPGAKSRSAETASEGAKEAPEETTKEKFIKKVSEQFCTDYGIDTKNIPQIVTILNDTEFQNFINAEQEFLTPDLIPKTKEELQIFIEEIVEVAPEGVKEQILALKTMVESGEGPKDKEQPFIKMIEEFFKALEAFLNEVDTKEDSEAKETGDEDYDDLAEDYNEYIDSEEKPKTREAATAPLDAMEKRADTQLASARELHDAERNNARSFDIQIADVRSQIDELRTEDMPKAQKEKQRIALHKQLDDLLTQQAAATERADAHARRIGPISALKKKIVAKKKAVEQGYKAPEPQEEGQEDNYDDEVEQDEQDSEDVPVPQEQEQPKPPVTLTRPEKPPKNPQNIIKQYNKMHPELTITFERGHVRIPHVEPEDAQRILSEVQNPEGLGLINPRYIESTNTIVGEPSTQTWSNLINEQYEYWQSKPRPKVVPSDGALKIMEDEANAMKKNAENEPDQMVRQQLFDVANKKLAKVARYRKNKAPKYTPRGSYSVPEEPTMSNAPSNYQSTLDQLNARSGDIKYTPRMDSGKILISNIRGTPKKKMLDSLDRKKVTDILEVGASTVEFMPNATWWNAQVRENYYTDNPEKRDEAVTHFAKNEDDSDYIHRPDDEATA